MKALDLLLLGRRLTKLAEETMRGPDAPHVPPGLRLIVTDLAEHPDSSIGEITARTGLPQSHVSASVARLRDRGAAETTTDPSDRRRTIARLTGDVSGRAGRLGSAPVDDALGKAMGHIGARERTELIGALERVLALLRTPE